MNVQEARFCNSTALDAVEDLPLEAGTSLIQRAASVAAVASSEADDVDRSARFPKAALDAARRQRLLRFIRASSAAKQRRSSTSPTCATRWGAPALLQP